ncbi:hypothetical protein [Reyranella sp.]|uniref:hypothetical protein n=1 Tax=Reyranella sp. TaxID=1929291 RepID=UPI003C7A4893
MAVTSSEMAAFFEEMKNGTYKCGFCGREEFVGNDIQQNTAVLQLPASLDVAPAPLAGSHAFLSISCANCGNATFFHINQFMAWRAKKTGRQKEEK